MQCERARELVSPYLDAELSPGEQRIVAAHVEGCARCAQLAADYRRIGRIVAGSAREPLPAVLVPRVRAALAASAREGSDGTRMLPAGPPGVGSISSRRRLRQAVALAAACLLTALTTWWIVSASAARGRLAQEVAAAHVRSLLQERQIDVASSDTHAVKPWFAGRIDFSPEVRTGEALALQGGRVDYIDGRRVAVLVYKRRQHTISVFQWPSASAEVSPSRAATQKGYNLLTWSHNGLTRWAVTDLNAEELRQLQDLM